MKTNRLILTLFALFVVWSSGIAGSIGDRTIDGLGYYFYRAGGTVGGGYNYTYPYLWAEVYYIYNGTPDVLTIPEKVTYNGKEYRVTGLRMRVNNAHGEVNLPVKIIAPHIIRAYGYGGDAKTSRLKSIEFSENLEYIGGLNNNPNLESVTWYPSTIKEIGANCFKDLAKLKSLPKLRFGENLEAIGKNAFENSQLIGEVSFQNSTNLKEISDEAFKGSSISYIDLPPNLETIGTRAFENCKKLFSGSTNGFTMPVTVKSIKTGAFANCTSLYWVDAKSCSALSFMNGVYDYSSYSGIFEGCTNLNKIAIGGISPKIGENMFRGCVNLESVSLPNTVERIGDEAFKDCVKLKNQNGIFDLPLAITYVGGQAFYNCTSLRVIRYPLVENRIVMDGGNAFGECIKLENILPIVVEDEEQQMAVRSRAVSLDRYSESGFRLWSRCPNLNISPYLICSSGKGTTYYIPAYMKEVDYTVVSSSLKCYAPDIKNCIFSSASERIGNECIKDFRNLERVILNATSIESDEESETEEP